jgi:hypothetical protein
MTKAKEIIRIKLRKNNPPKSPGVFIMKRTCNPKPEVAELRLNEYDGLFTVVLANGIFPLRESGSALWSNKILFTES